MHEIAGYEHVSPISDQNNIGEDALNLKESTWQKRSKGVSVFYNLQSFADHRHFKANAGRTTFASQNKEQPHKNIRP